MFASTPTSSPKDETVSANICWFPSMCCSRRAWTITRLAAAETLPITGHPILNLGAIRRDVVWYVRTLEEAMIRATAEFGITAERVAGKTGIWVRVGNTEEKLAAIGVHISRWVTSHGFAYNVSTDLRNFDLIVPCGIADRKPTSLEKLLGRRIEVGEVAPRISKYLGELLALEMKESSKKELLGKLEHAEQAVAISA